MTSATVLRPPLPYYGGKQTIAPAVVDLMPEHAIYVEPYAGSLAVLLAKHPVKREIVNDLDGELVTFWRVLRDRPDDLARVCEFTPHARAEHEAAFEPTSDELEIARRVWVRLTQGRAATLRGTGWKQSLRSSSSMPRMLHGYRVRLLPAAERMRGVTLECRPALEVIDSYDREGVVMYVDPPYVGSTGRAVGYREEMMREADHVELIERLLRCKAFIFLSGYAHPMYDMLLGSWARHTFSSITGGETREEVVWTNHVPELASSRLPDTSTFALSNEEKN
jgi:DNA adenine methylase